MATSSNHDDGEGTVSMVDVLEESEELEEEARAVLGDSDDKCCTYVMGYQDRQALYACSSCSTPGGASAGICLACSYACHDGHDLFELYTKRNFKCDCGNSKFPVSECKLIPDKSKLNEDNKYNQNFKGLYCSCNRPYPDPDDEVEDEMIQCIVCEDWYHGRHLGLKELPSNHEYQEMICPACMGHCEFLWPYTVHSIETTELKVEDIKGQVDVVSDQKTRAKVENQSCQDAPTATGSTGDEGLSVKPGDVCDTNKRRAEDTTAKNEIEEQKEEESVDVEAEMNPPDTRPIATTTCQLQLLRERDVKKSEGAVFWGKGWRSKLCGCPSCKELYERLQVSFLLSEEDTVLAYEERGKLNQSGMSQYEKGMQALSHLDRTQQVEVLQGYHDMKSELRDFLDSFAQSGKVVQREDIDKFFGEMQAKKRQKTGPMQYFCR